MDPEPASGPDSEIACDNVQIRILYLKRKQIRNTMNIALKAERTGTGNGNGTGNRLGTGSGTGHRLGNSI